METKKKKDEEEEEVVVVMVASAPTEGAQGKETAVEGEMARNKDHG